MNLINTLKTYQKRCTAPGSPLRYLRKAYVALRHPGSTLRRARIGTRLAADLSADSRSRVAALHATGYATAGPEIDAGLLAELDRAADAKLQAGGQGKSLRSFFTQITDDSDLHADSIYVRFALQPGIQKIVSAYFGHVPYLADVQVLKSHGTDHDTWEESQLWHRDYGDSKTIKLWVYLTAVEQQENGPFTYLPVAPSAQVPNTFIPGRVSDEAMSASGLADQAVAVYGPRLKSFYIDTALCYHLGSRLQPGQIRVAYIATFLSHASLYPFNNRIATHGKLSETEKLLLSI